MVETTIEEPKVKAKPNVEKMKKKKNLKWKDLENLMGNIIVNSISSQYVVYIVGYHPCRNPTLG